MELSSNPANPCGSCILCCKIRSVPEIGKLRDRLCAVARPGRGCAIHPARPLACMAFSCYWLRSQQWQGQVMPAQLRPDRCHVVFSAPANNDVSVTAHVDPARPAAWRDPPAIDLIASFLETGTPVVIVIAGLQMILRRPLAKPAAPQIRAITPDWSALPLSAADR